MDLSFTHLLSAISTSRYFELFFDSPGNSKQWDTTVCFEPCPPFPLDHVHGQDINSHLAGGSPTRHKKLLKKQTGGWEASRLTWNRFAPHLGYAQRIHNVCIHVLVGTNSPGVSLRAGWSRTYIWRKHRTKTTTWVDFEAAQPKTTSRACYM